jgi:hypothetical protein
MTRPVPLCRARSGSVLALLCNISRRNSPAGYSSRGRTLAIANDGASVIGSNCSTAWCAAIRATDLGQQLGIERGVRYTRQAESGNE